MDSLLIHDFLPDPGYLSQVHQDLRGNDLDLVMTVLDQVQDPRQDLEIEHHPTNPGFLGAELDNL